MTRTTAMLSVALCVAFTTALAILCGSAQAMPYGGRPVALTDAEIAPAWISVAGPGETVMPPTVNSNRYGAPCIGRHGHAFYASDVSAYTGTGRALPAQTRTRFADHWGRVSYDGVAFHNHYHRRTVLVAVWCERGTVPTR